MGGVSQIECELLLLKTAISKGKYDYLHLLSGDDLPVKNNDEIDSFFEVNNGKQYIAVTGKVEKAHTTDLIFIIFLLIIGVETSL